MASCSKDCCSCCICTLRLWIFFFCILSIIGQAFLIWFAASYDNPLVTKFPELANTPASIIVGITYSALAALGAYGAHTNNPKLLKMFAGLMAAFSLLSLALLGAFISSDSWKESVKRPIERLFADQKEFQWTVKEGEQENNATIVWNFIQRHYVCCGLNGPQDWLKYKPSDYPRDVPKSCCRRTIQDTDCSLNTIGCNQQIAQMSLSAFKFSSYSNVMIALFAFIVAKYSESMRHNDNGQTTDRSGNDGDVESAPPYYRPPSLPAHLYNQSDKQQIPMRQLFYPNLHKAQNVPS